MADDKDQKSADEAPDAKANEKFDPKRTAAESPEAKADAAPESKIKGEGKPDAKAEPADAKAEKADAKAEPADAKAAKQAIEKTGPTDVQTEEKKHLAVVSEAQLTKPPTGNVVAQAWLVLALAVGFGSGLAALERSVGPVIAQNKLDETLSQVPSLVPGAARGEADENTIPGKRVFRALDGEGKLVGWVINGQGQGFGDKIELIIGLDAKAETLTGVFVLDQKETPALGDNIKTKDFQERFVGISTNVTLDAMRAPTDKATGTIQALTGATISSDAVCAIINRTVSSMKADLAAAASPVAMGDEK
jgi:electron transport complex protein RnfG